MQQRYPLITIAVSLLIWLNVFVILYKEQCFKYIDYQPFSFFRVYMGESFQ